MGIRSADEVVEDDELGLQDMKIYSHSSVEWVEDLGVSSSISEISSVVAEGDDHLRDEESPSQKQRKRYHHSTSRVR
jgi:hypothetical protein